MQEPKKTHCKSYIVRTLIVAVGYLAACFIFDLVLMAPTTLSFLLTIRALPLTLLFALPGFLIARLVFYYFGRSDLLSFSFAGLLNTAFVALPFLLLGEISLQYVFGEPLTLLVAIAGALAGAASWGVEMYLNRRSFVTSSMAIHL